MLTTLLVGHGRKWPKGTGPAEGGERSERAACRLLTGFTLGQPTPCLTAAIELKELNVLDV